VTASTTSAGGSCCIIQRPSAPSRASTTRKPSSCRTVRSAERVAASSSTTSTGRAPCQTPMPSAEQSPYRPGNMPARVSLGTGMRRRLLTLCLAATVAACGTNVAASPMPAPFPLAQAELKYRVMDAGGRIEFCDPDFYPIARADEQELANAKIGQIQAAADTYAAITKRV